MPRCSAAATVPLVTVGVALLEERLVLLPHKLLELRTLDARFSLLAAGSTRGGTSADARDSFGSTLQPQHDYRELCGSE